MPKHRSIQLEDLRYLSIECECGTKVVLDLKGRQGTLDECPLCKKPYDPGLQLEVRAFSRALENAGVSRHKLSFNIPVEQTD